MKNITFPKFSGIRCNMMPFIQGDPSSVPVEYEAYREIISELFLEKGEIGHLTIDESFVMKGNSQRGYNSKNVDRNVHIEVGYGKEGCGWGGPMWGGSFKTILDESTRVLIANSVSETCRVWDVLEKSYTLDGDLSAYLDKYPENTGRLLRNGEIAEISIFTPHECVPQDISSERQFIRIVGKGVCGREDYFTANPLFKNMEI